VRPSESPCQYSRVCAQHIEIPVFIKIPVFDDRAHLRVSQLAKVAVTTIGTRSPSKKNIAGRLHQTLTSNNSFSVVLMHTFAYVRLERRGPRFLDLREKRVCTGKNRSRPCRPL
jgi:hypothetical protein